jgi:hypothetical protein
MLDVSTNDASSQPLAGRAVTRRPVGRPPLKDNTGRGYKSVKKRRKSLSDNEVLLQIAGCGGCRLNERRRDTILVFAGSWERGRRRRIGR